MDSGYRVFARSTTVKYNSGSETKAFIRITLSQLFTTLENGKHWKMKKKKKKNTRLSKFKETKNYKFSAVKQKGKY